MAQLEDPRTSGNRADRKQRKSGKENSLAWIYENVPTTVLWTLGGIIVGAFVAGATVGQTTFIRELMGKDARPKISSEELKSRVDQLIQGHNESIKSLYAAIANEEKEAGKVFYLTEQGPHVDAAKRLKELLKQENETFAQQLKTLKDLEK